MNKLLVSLENRFGNRKTALISLGVFVVVQLLFASANALWTEFGTVTKIMPDLNPGYTQSQLRDVIAQLGAMKSAVFSVYLLDTVLPIAANVLTLSLIALLIKYLSRSYSLLLYLPLLFPLISFIADYSENLIVLSLTILQPSAVPSELLALVTTIKLLCSILGLVTVLLMAAAALVKKLSSRRVAA